MYLKKARIQNAWADSSQRKLLKSVPITYKQLSLEENAQDKKPIMQRK